MLHFGWYRYAVESINLACKWGYKGVKEGATLAGKLNYNPIDSKYKYMNTSI